MISTSDSEPVYKRLGISRDEALLVAYIPVVGDLMDEYPWQDNKRTGTLFAYEGKAMDILPDDSKGVKWWLVKNCAREHRLDIIEPFLTCPAEDFRIESLPQVPRPENHLLAFRMYSRGPWITLEKPPKDDSAAEA